jgi:hypothetical protein
MMKNPTEILSKNQTPYICSSKCKLIVKPNRCGGNQNKKTVAYENNEKKMESVYSKRIKAGKRRTYFFDVKATRGNDFYLTITESRKRFNEETYERHKIFLYKEDFNKFLKGLTEAVDYVKTDLMPDFDFDAFSHEYPDGEFEQDKASAPSIEHSSNGNGMAAGNNGISFQAAEVPEPLQIEVVSEEIPVSFAVNGTNEEVDKW